MAYGPSKDVHFRIAQTAYEAESAAAQALGQSLAMRLRGVVERDAALLAELQGMRADLDRLVDSLDESGPATDAKAGMLAEILMLARMTATPEKVRMAQSEVVRIGLKVWEAKDGADQRHNEPPASPPRPAPVAPAKRGIFGRR